MKFIPQSTKYRQAERDADAARAAFLQSLRHARERLTPGSLKADATQMLQQAITSARQEATITARKHLFIVVGIITGVIVFLARKPLMALSRRAGVSIRKAWRARRHSGDEQ